MSAAARAGGGRPPTHGQGDAPPRRTGCAGEARRPAHGQADAVSGRTGCAGDLAARAADLAGLNLKAVGEAVMLAALDKAASGLGLDVARYLGLAALDPGKRRVLAGEAVVQEGWLFREPETFVALRSLAPSLPRPVRALCVPCAGGEEPVSMALTFLDAGFIPGEFHIDAVDVSESALAAARSGVFGPRSVRSDIGQALGRFTRSGADLVLDPVVAGSIRYLAGDVLDEDFLAHEPPYQVVFCRNLLIYLNPSGRERLAATLRRLLAKAGILFAASAEAAALLGLGFSLGGGQNCAPVLTSGLTPDPALPVRKGRKSHPLRAGAFAPSAHGTAGREGGESSTADTGGFPGSFPPAGNGACAGAVAEDASPRPGGSSAPAPAHSRLLDEARVLAGAGRLEEALSIVERALGLEEPGPDLFALKGAALLALGRKVEAEAAFRRALYLDPCHVEALGHLELLARDRGNAAEAERLAARLERAQASRARP